MKILILSFLLFIAYKLFIKPDKAEPLDDIRKKEIVEEEGFTDYEELE